VEKLILDTDPDLDQSQNLIKCSSTEGLLVPKNHEHSQTFFWVILFLFNDKKAICLNAAKVKKIILDPELDSDQSKNLIKCSLSELLPSQKFDEHSSTTFWLSNTKRVCLSMLEKWKNSSWIHSPDHSQNLTDWSLANSLSFHNIWFKSVNNFFRYSAD